MIHPMPVENPERAILEKLHHNLKCRLAAFAEHPDGFSAASIGNALQGLREIETRL